MMYYKFLTAINWNRDRDGKHSDIDRRDETRLNVDRSLAGDRDPTKWAEVG